MKVLFISHVPEHYVLHREPMGIMTLSSILKKSGHTVRLCSPRIRDVEHALKIFPAEVVAYSVTTGYHNFYRNFNEALKKSHKHLISVFGGPHTTFSPDFIEQSHSIDAICRGEGDYAFAEFLDKLSVQNAREYYRMALIRSSQSLVPCVY